MRLRSHICAALIAVVLSGCGSQRPLNPPALVTARDTDMAIQLFMQATILLARYHGFAALEYEEVRDRSVRHGYPVLPFMPPISGRATPRFDQQTLPSSIPGGLENLSGLALVKWLEKVGGRRTVMEYYVNTGWRAAQMICRNYLIGLDERNSYLEFLQKEFNIGSALAHAFLTIGGANFTALSVLHGINVGGNLTIDEYQSFRYLAVDRNIALELVESEQEKLAAAFLKRAANSTFADAVEAVSRIEYQCTRTGIKGLINDAAKKDAEAKKKKTEAPKSAPKPSKPACPAPGHVTPAPESQVKECK